MQLLRESMSRFAFDGCVIRVWREEPLASIINKAELAAEIDSFRKQEPDGGCPFLIRRLIRVSRVNAVEWTNEQGDGEVLYKDWP